MIRDQIIEALNQALLAANLPVEAFSLDHPADLKHGDYASNVALILAKKHNHPALEVASNLVREILRQDYLWLAKAEVAGPGFINFYLSDQYLGSELKSIIANTAYGANNLQQKQKIMIEYTDPNPFKLFHIGHLMSNTIGESLARLLEFSGAEVKRACYQGDVGLHVAKALWGIKQDLAHLPIEADSLAAKVRFLGRAYAAGSAATGAEAEILTLNKQIYDRSDPELNRLYDLGKQWSLDYFETIYQRLGTKFDFYFLESQAGVFGQELVASHPETFVKSAGAIVYQGEAEGLHTRVFINQAGLPTYEAKELALAKIKFDHYPYDQSLVITGNEITEYFKVLLAALTKIFPELAQKTKHLTHGMLRLPSGKMSSRTGQVITAEEILTEISKKLAEKIGDKKIEASAEVLDQIAAGAIKYSILKQEASKDLIFDLDKSISFEGNSGPYLQYTYARAKSLLAKAGADPTTWSAPAQADSLEHLLYLFPEVVELAATTYAPHQLCTYLYELASAFNNFYNQGKIIGASDEAYRLALTAAAAQILGTGLKLLGIATPDRM
jgi:arginyl-tRNA synthetase